MAVLLGILLGLSTLIFIGPVLLYLAKVSIENGFKGGISVALGIMLGDAICIAITLTGMKKVFSQEENLYWFALAGGFILLTLGLKYIISPSIHIKLKENVKIKNQTLFVYFINGFAVNFINPFVFAVWFGFGSYLESQLPNDNQVIVGLIVALIVIFLTDLLKAFYANKILDLIKPSKLKGLFKLFGIGMILFSFRLFYYCYIS